VLATQNPREFEGTYPLPESQLDRFMLRIDVGYPERANEMEILNRYGGMMTAIQTTLATVGTLQPVLLQEARNAADGVHVSNALAGYVLDLARASREHAQLSLGLSTRGGLALLKAARIVAGLRGSEFVAPDDVKEAAPWVIAHRLVLTPEAALEGLTDVRVVKSLLADTPVPR
jgi:MoxR-like ATPase